MRTAFYARVSTQRQAQADGIAQQLDRLQGRALAQGWTVAEEDIFRDDGYSGANLKRPGLERLRDRVALACSRPGADHGAGPAGAALRASSAVAGGDHGYRLPGRVP